MSHKPSRARLIRPWVAGTFMASLGKDLQRSLLGLAERRHHRVGETLIRQGDTQVDHVMVLCSVTSSVPACVKVTLGLDNGAETLLGIRVSGDIVGEMAVVRGTARSATVTTCTQVVVHRIPAKAFVAFLDEHPRLWSVLSATIASRLDWSNRRRLDFAAFDVPIRLARVLIELADRHGRPTPDGVDLGVGLSHVELGRLIGARESAVEKAVRALKEAGLVANRYRRVIVTDVEGLRAWETSREPG